MTRRAIGQAVAVRRSSWHGPQRLTDHVRYMACWQCGWRANVAGGRPPRACPDCRTRVLTMLHGPIARVAARLDRFPDSG